MRKFSLLLALVLCGAFPVSAQGLLKKDTVKLTKVEFEGVPAAGGRVMAHLHFEIEEGFHTQSHKPSEEYFIATDLKLELPAGIKAGKTVYPKGKEEVVVGLDKPMSLYEGEFVVQVPLAISVQTTLPVTLEGALEYQACKGATCYPPKKLKVAVKLDPNDAPQAAKDPKD